MGVRTTFPRVSGGIVLDSFSIVSFFTGLLAAIPAGLVLLAGSAGPRSSGAGAAAFVAWGLTVLVFVSRFGQLGIAGDSEGGLFSGSAGPWSGTLLAALRLLVLWAAWALPVVAWALLKGEAQAGGLGALGGLPFVPRVPVLLSIWTGVGFVVSFAFVAVSAAAPGFGDLFSPGLWRVLFAGRGGELFVAIGGTFGPPIAVAVFATPFVGVLSQVNPKLGLAGLGLLLAYVAGMVLTLQGKLCGAFSAASLAEEVEAPGAGIVAFERERSRTAIEGHLPAEAPVAASVPPAAAPENAAQPAPAMRDPRSLHVLWQTSLAAGDAEGAFETAKEAIPAGLAKGEPRLAATIYRQHLDRLSELGLDRASLDLLADQLLHDGDVAAAAWTYSQALDADPSDAKAFKGLLRVGDHYFEKKEPLEAVRIYRYLLQRAPSSPFADHVRGLLGDAERKATRPPAAQG